jgi:hypothetical protein
MPGDIAHVIQYQRSILAWRRAQHAADLLQVKAE